MTVEDPSNEGVQVALVHELARLSLGKDRYFVNFIAECDATPGEKLVALLQAASASTSPVGRFIRSIKDLMLNMVDLTLISSYLEQTIKYHMIIVALTNVAILGMAVVMTLYCRSPRDCYCSKRLSRENGLVM